MIIIYGRIYEIFGRRYMKLFPRGGPGPLDTAPPAVLKWNQRRGKAARPQPAPHGGGQTQEDTDMTNTTTQEANNKAQAAAEAAQEAARAAEAATTAEAAHRANNRAQNKARQAREWAARAYIAANPGNEPHSEDEDRAAAQAGSENAKARMAAAEARHTADEAARRAQRAARAAAKAATR